MDIIHEITPLSEKDCFYIVDRRKTEFTYPIHCHLEYELNFIEHAPGVRRVVGDSAEVIGEYELVLITGKELEHVWEQNACKSPLIHEITIQFSPNLFGNNILEKNQFNSIRKMLEKAQRGISFPMSSILKVYHLLEKLVSEEQSFYAVINFLTILYELSIEEDYKVLASSSFAKITDIHSESRRIQKVQNYINERYQQDIRLNLLAELVGMAPSAFSRFFKLRTGKTLSDYITDIRIGYAARMLVDTQRSIGWNWGMTHTLSYAFDVKENHFDVLVGTEYSREGNNMSETIEGHATTSIFGDFSHAYFNNFSGRTAGIVGGYPVDDHSILSYFGRINYDLKETYMFSAIVRADGSSNFSSGHRWGYFPSFSAGWVMSNESWMENTKNWMDFLKVRASWGQNGNENIGAYKYASTYAFGDLGLYSFNNNKNGGTQGAYPSLLPNNEITWETSEQTNVGLDARFLNGRLNANFDWYSKKTKDLLIDVPVSSINGFSSMVANAGTVKNTGIELALNWRDEVGSDFSYGIGLNLAHNKNEVTEVNNGTHYVNGGNALLSEGTTYMARMEEGHPIGYFWGYKTDGVMQNQADIQAYLDQNCGGDASNSLQGTSIAPGDLKFVDVNGDGVINDSDKTEIGNPHPDLTMGLNLDFSWKGFDLNISTYGAFGMQVAHTYRKFGNGQFDNYSSNVYNYWHGEGTSNRYPILLPGNTVNHINISDIYVDDADYFRIQNVTLGYDIKRLWKSCKFQQLRLYVSAQNLFTFTGYKGMDPECGTALNDKESWVTGVDVGNYPQARTYMVGVNVKF